MGLYTPASRDPCHGVIQHIYWEPFPRVTFQTLNTWTACHRLIRTNAGGSSDFSGDPQQHQSTAVGFWVGGLEGSWMIGEDGCPSKWLVFSLWKACQNFHNWHGPTVRTCILSPLHCFWVYVLYNLVCQAIITGPPAAPVAPGSSLEMQIPGLPQELLKSESVFWQDPGWLVAPFNVGRSGLLKTHRDFGLVAHRQLPRSEGFQWEEITVSANSEDSFP